MTLATLITLEIFSGQTRVLNISNYIGSKDYNERETLTPPLSHNSPPSSTFDTVEADFF